MQQHEACGYSYIVARCDGQTEPSVISRGPDAAKHFLDAIQEEERHIKDILSNPKLLRMTPQDWKIYKTRTNCHICDKPLIVAGEQRDTVLDHCHITGKF